MSADDLYNRVSLDNTYFMASGGGITFGGGEPLQYAADIAEFRKFTREDYTIYAETSLHVSEKAVRRAASCIDRFYVDIKTLDEDKYREYTDGDVKVLLKNLQILQEEAGSERIIIRIPMIPGVTSTTDQERYCKELEEKGFGNFDKFTYLTRSNTV